VSKGVVEVIRRPLPVSSLALCAGMLILDQVTKHLTIRFLRPGDPVAVIPGFFNLVHVHNPGAAFGMMHGFSPGLFLVSAVTLGLLMRFHYHLFFDTRIHRVALGLVLGGIVGNMVDRLKYHYVIDFLDFHIGAHHWPAFNVADSCICIGAAIYLFTSIRSPAPASRAA